MKKAKKRSGNADAINRALSHHQKGELLQAEAIYREVLSLEPNNGDALNLLGMVAYQAGKNEAAIELIEKAIALNRAVPVYHNNAGIVYYALNRLDKAAASYRRALSLKPDDHMAHYNLGNALKELGKLDEAIASYRRALSLKPDDHMAHINLGNALKELGRLDEAIASYRRALSLKPDDHKVHNNLGSVLKELGRLDEAIVCYQRALLLKPDYHMAHYNLGNALKEQGKLDEAIAAYNNAIVLKPDYHEAYNNLGTVLMEQGKLDEAIAAYNNAIVLKPDYHEAYNNLGVVLIEQGKFGEARAAFRKAIAVDENYTVAYLYLTICKKFTEADRGFIETIREMLELAEIKDEDAANLRFALGKIYDDLGRFGDAFSNYHEANRLENRKHRFDRDKHSGNISRLIETFTPEFFSQRRAFGSDSDLPIMVLGMMRSGTTLVEQIVASHPLVHGAGELQFWSKRAPDDIMAMTRDVAASIAGEYIDYLRSFSKRAEHVTDKMPNNYLHIGLIHLVFPKARIIHLKRNPVDTCLSIYFHKFLVNHPYGYDLDNLVFYYKQYRRLMSHWRGVLPSEVFYEVNYEDLIKDQENVSRALIRFCGLPWDEKCLRFHLTERPVKTASNWQVRQPIYKNSMARWKNYRQFLGPLAELLTEED